MYYTVKNLKFPLLKTNKTKLKIDEPLANADWRTQMSAAIRHPEQLLKLLPPTFCLPQGWEIAAAKFPMLATPYYLALAESASMTDPIFRQIMPEPAEVDPHWAGDPDALAENEQSPVPRLIHRYPDRAVLLTTDNCATRCRHCLRKRRWAQADKEMTDTEFDSVIDYLEATPEIREVLVSGGDPLILEDERLKFILTRLRAVKSLRILRIGTRVPVVLPQRLTEDFCRMLGAVGGVWMATHFNHPLEVTEQAAAACARLQKNGVPMVNQAVLLRNVNDDVETLRELGWRLLECGVKPYYLFHGDPIDGARHFRTGLKKGMDIMRELRKTTSGLAVPNLALDLPGGEGKVVLEPDAAIIKDQPDATPKFIGRSGRTVEYSEY